MSCRGRFRKIKNGENQSISSTPLNFWKLICWWDAPAYSNHVQFSMFWSEEYWDELNSPLCITNWIFILKINLWASLQKSSFSSKWLMKIPKWIFLTNWWLNSKNNSARRDYTFRCHNHLFWRFYIENEEKFIKGIQMNKNQFCSLCVCFHENISMLKFKKWEMLQKQFYFSVINWICIFRCRFAKYN